MTAEETYSDEISFVCDVVTVHCARIPSNSYQLAAGKMRYCTTSCCRHNALTVAEESTAMETENVHNVMYNRKG
jgi:hypothetical protein